MTEKVEGQSLIISRVNLGVGSSIIIAKRNVARVSMHCNSEYIFFLGIYNISLNSKRKQETIYKWRESNHSLCDLKPKKKKIEMGIIPPELKPRNPFGNIMGNKLVVLKVWFTNHSSKKFTYSFTNPRAWNTCT